MTGAAGFRHESLSPQHGPESPGHDEGGTMSIAERQAEVVWEGELAHGVGTLSSGSGALDELAVTWASRTEAPDGKTSPEELIAAAHASCFAMALSLVLGKAKATPEQLLVRARCTLDEVEGAPRITRSALELRGRVTGLDERGFDDAVDKARRLCPVSNALAGSVELPLESTFETTVEEARA
jgi:osmotically inducible protein OsmC